MMRQRLIPLILAATLGAQDRVVTKDGVQLDGTILSHDAQNVVIADPELGVLQVPRTKVSELRIEGSARSFEAATEPPDSYIRWSRPGSGEGGLWTGTSAYHHAPSDTTIWLVGVCHIGDPQYFTTLQGLLDSADIVLFEGVGRGDATEEQMAELDSLMKMQIAMRGALDLGYQKDWVDYSHPFWRNSDIAFDDMQAELDRRGASMPTDNPMVKQLMQRVMSKVDPNDIGSPSLAPRIRGLMGPVLAQADSLLARPQFAGMRGVIIEYRNEAVMADLDALLADGERGRTVAVFYGAGHLPDFDLRFEERELELTGVRWDHAWRVSNDRATSDRKRELDDIVRSTVNEYGDRLSVGAWIGEPDGTTLWARRPLEPLAAASAIKTAYLVELFARYAGRLDEAIDVAAILDAHPEAIEHFDEATRKTIRQQLHHASARKLAEAMIKGTGVSNAVYNAAANVVTAMFGGPEDLTRRIQARWGRGAEVRRYMLAARDVTGDNEASPRFLARVLTGMASDRVPGVHASIVAEMRTIMFSGRADDGTIRFSKSGALSTDPMARISSGWTNDGRVWVVMCQARRTAQSGYEKLTEVQRALTERLMETLDAPR